jgi:hypothetical protein
MSDNNILNGLAEYFRRSGRNLASVPGNTYSALADMAGSVPHLPFAENGIRSYGGAVTGADTPYYGDDEISAAREQFDRVPRSNTSRLIDLIGNAAPGAATGPKTAIQRASKAAQNLPIPTQSDEIRKIMDDLRRGMAEASAQKVE